MSRVTEQMVTEKRAGTSTILPDQTFSATMDAAATLKYITEKWDYTIVPTLQEFIKIPNQSPGT